MGNLKHGKNFKAGSNVIIKDNCLFGDNVEIGNNVVIYEGTTFGNNVFVMDNCVIGKQPLPPFQEHKAFKIAKMKPLKFGSNIVIGTGSIFYAGSKIGDYFYSADSVIVREGCLIAKNVSVGKKAIVEHHVSLGANTKLQSYALVGEGMKVGENVFVGPFFNGTCDKFMDRLEQFVFQPPIIKDYVRIGAHVVIMAGTTLGKDSVVGAGAVVTKDVPAYSVTVGVPAKVVKKLAKAHRHKKIEKMLIKKSLDSFKNFDEFWREIVNLRGDSPCLFDAEDTSRQFSFVQLNDYVDRTAYLLKKEGLKKADRFIALTENCVEFFFLYLASMKLGTLIVPVTPSLSQAEILSIIERFTPVLIFADEKRFELARQCKKEKPCIQKSFFP